MVMPIAWCGGCSTHFLILVLSILFGLLVFSGLWRFSRENGGLGCRNHTQITARQRSIGGDDFVDKWPIWGNLLAVPTNGLLRKVDFTSTIQSPNERTAIDYQFVTSHFADCFRQGRSFCLVALLFC
jgi:hypothetical protein